MTETPRTRGAKRGHDTVSHPKLERSERTKDVSSWWLGWRLARYLPRVLAEAGLLVLETAAKFEPALPLALRTSRRYGSARLTLYEHP